MIAVGPRMARETALGAVMMTEAEVVEMVVESQVWARRVKAVEGKRERVLEEEEAEGVAAKSEREAEGREAG